MRRVESGSAREYRYRAYDHDSVKPDRTSPFFLDHVSRYWWAGGFATGKRVLDCATGSGYGAYVLSRGATDVLGIDLNQNSLAFAQARFTAANLAFQEWDVLELPRLGRRFDVVTAFEIIEHLPPAASDRFLAGIVEVLEPGGLALISTPNHDVVVKSGMAVPEFHVNNLGPRELRRLLRRHFPEVRLLGQFVERPAPMRWLFALDFYNLRHTVRRALMQVGRAAAMRPVFARSPALSSPPPAADGPTPSRPPEIGRGFFDRPCAGVERYRFSVWHWRQAGLTLAICVK